MKRIHDYDERIARVDATARRDRALVSTRRRVSAIARESSRRRPRARASCEAVRARRYAAVCGEGDESQNWKRPRPPRRGSALALRSSEREPRAASAASLGESFHDTRRRQRGDDGATTRIGSRGDRGRDRLRDSPPQTRRSRRARGSGRDPSFVATKEEAARAAPRRPHRDLIARRPPNDAQPRRVVVRAMARPARPRPGVPRRRARDRRRALPRRGRGRRVRRHERV